ncbi:MAG: hypothetical protein CM1200mP39_14880 [Dehalococcoidia bacterium]|nr:MAG: hypothetical protein CM1200mP39_14880 [Dehalococcoidia bacterium]
MYDPSSCQWDLCFSKNPEENTPLFNRARAKFHTAEAEEINPEDPEVYWRELRAKYFGNVTVLDRGIAPIFRPFKIRVSQTIR